LPPNVFYREVEHEGKVLRCKYAVISSADFSKHCSKKRFESYIWGRFAQPIGLVWNRDTSSLQAVELCLQAAVSTFLSRCLPALPVSGSIDALWSNSLALSYGTELRSERVGRPDELAGASREHFAEVTQLVANSIGYGFSVCSDGESLRYEASFSRLQKLQCRVSWMLRRLQGKLMSVLRLLKAFFTFDGGLDYIAWKLERHSGQKVEIPNRVRRFPLVFVWGFCWQLYRRGIFK
jgi:hypothetical protein